MTETEVQGIDRGLEIVDGLLTKSQSQAEAQPYDFAMPEFTLNFPVVWPNKEGRIRVTHKLRRATLGDLIEWKKKYAIEREHDKRGKFQRESVNNISADDWLWNQLALAVGDYPDIEGMKPVTAEDKIAMRSTHKEAAIASLFRCEADILLEESVATFGGGEWVVALKVYHNADGSANTVKFRFREWTQKERSDFTKLATISDIDSEGKNTVSRSAVNLPTFTDLFDELLIDIVGGVVKGKTMAEMGRLNFIREICAEYKAVIIAELTLFWRKQLSD